MSLVSAQERLEFSLAPETYTSTKALSIYNALSLSGRDLTTSETLEYLRTHFDPKYQEQWIAEGLEYLTSRKYVVTVGDRIIPTRERNHVGRCFPLKRANEEKDLVWA